MRSLLVIILFLSLNILSAADSATRTSHCAASLLLPAGLHMLETPECFSLDLAEEFSAEVGSLERYLDRFDGAPSAHAYRYWQFLRTERFLPALLTLVELVNSSPVIDPAIQFQDELSFLVVSGIKRIPHEVNLFDRPGLLSSQELSDRFFFICDQVISLYNERSSNVSRRDSWIIYRALALFFSSTNGGPLLATDDLFAKELIGRYYSLWKEGVLLPYLSFYTFFTAGDRTFLPTESTYAEKLIDRVPLPKSHNGKKEQTAMESIARLMGRFSIDNLALLPTLSFIDTDDVRKWYRETHPEADGEHEERCGVLDERHNMLAPYRDDLFGPFLYNRALSLMEGCDPRHALPFVIAGGFLYIAAADRWLRDIAVAYYLIRERKTFSYREASGLLSGALATSIARYRKEGKGRPFGKTLLYAYYTDRIGPFRDALFLYRQYGDEPSVFTKEKTDETVDFVNSFFWGAKEEEN
ncbi:MAG TPA: hypothetical protein PLV42_07410 [bacterium]|nr:hypothetical protein [bacterium]